MKSFVDYKSKNIGIVTEVRFPLVKVKGLKNAFLNEVVVFEHNRLGQIYSLEDSTADVLVFYKGLLQTGSKGVLTGEKLSLPVGRQMLGQLIDPLGNPLDKDRIKREIGEVGGIGRKVERYPLEVKPLGIGKRARIKKSLHTGISMVDFLVPLGCGQRELILGDRKTGKSALLRSIAKAQLTCNDNPPVVIYAAVGKRQSEIKALEEFFEKEGLLKNMVMVATSSFDSPGLIHLTPFAAMSLAEYFRDNGKDTLVLLDDLSTHARFYREIALLARRFPGRDSYPGDIFYTHARLLERAGNFKTDRGDEISITCLPLAETLEGDLTGYITTNLMGVTDGHIFFDSNIFYKGRRPAINAPLSVTRVGKQTQGKLQKSISRIVNDFLIKYETAQNISHFGAELTDETKQILIMGEKITEFFDQSYNLILPQDAETALFALIWQRLIGDDPRFPISVCRLNLVKNYTHLHVQGLLAQLSKVEDMDKLLANVLKKKEELIKLCQTD
ncbi:hypothetical protein A3C26_00465 [Candidatus Daviesbacteria bacterium RIFCSPHIGHO2_02_FULL_39_12]|nr:MAG: hypothetical protein A3C26_00465 [Candidatus Daviesbacteria bacterium RIFCSPHIGHO2_02_FULL_39_12]